MFLPPLGSLIANKYRLESLLGEGGMGAVFRARHEIMEKGVAVKWLKPTCGDEFAAKRRFIQEARAAARIRHPNVVDVYDVGEQDGCLFMVMELLEGETFGDLLERGPVPRADAVRYLLAAMRGVAAAHAAGITHRDIKPENIFIATDALHADGIAKILDFGISKLHDEPSSNLTVLGTAVGTPHYMSIEQIRGESDVDQRTDVYAFGVLLYRALTGALPYDAETLPGIVFQASMGRAIPPVELCPDLPQDLNEIILKAIALRRDDRFQSMGELIGALSRAELALTLAPPPAAQSPAYIFALPPQPTARPPVTARLPLWASKVLGRDTIFGAPIQGHASSGPTTLRGPLNPWLGLVGVALGMTLGGTLYTQLMTPATQGRGESETAVVLHPARGARVPAGLPVVTSPYVRPEPRPRSKSSAQSASRASSPTALTASAHGATAQPPLLAGPDGQALLTVPQGPLSDGPVSTNAPSGSQVQPASPLLRQAASGFAAREATPSALSKVVTRAPVPGAAPKAKVTGAPDAQRVFASANTSAPTERTAATSSTGRRAPSSAPTVTNEEPARATPSHRSGQLRREDL